LKINHLATLAWNTQFGGKNTTTKKEEEKVGKRFFLLSFFLSFSLSFFLSSSEKTGISKFQT
jgi:hypothetical protein